MVKVNRDVIVVAAIITLMVSSSAAWYLNVFVENKTTEIITTAETPFTVLQSSYYYLGSNMILLTLELQNMASTTQSTNIEIQAVDSAGNIITDDGEDLIQYDEALNIMPDGTYTNTYLFQKSGIRTELSVFLIVLWWEDTQGIFTTGGGLSEQPKALIGYRGSDISGPKYPKYRFYDVAWSDAMQLNEPADQEVRIVRTRYNPASGSTDNALMVLITDQNYIDAYKYDGFSWNFQRLGRVWTSEPYSTLRPFDVAYEKTSGDAVIVYKDGSTDPLKDIVYRIWDGSQWSQEYYIDDPGGRKEYYWLTLASSPVEGSNEVALLGVTQDGYASCWIWDGSSWGSFHRLSTSVSEVRYETASMAYEYSSGDLLVTVAEGKYIRAATYGGSWSPLGTFSLVLNPTSKTPNINWVVAKPHQMEGSDKIMLMAMDANAALYTCLWTGSSWQSTPELMDSKLNSASTRCFDGDWLPTSTTFILVAGDFNTAALSYKVWLPDFWLPSGANLWANYWGMTTKQNWVQVRSYMAAEPPRLLIGTEDSSGDLVITMWDGLIFTEQTEVTTESTALYEAFDIAFSYQP